jgi:hypothetical protein
MTHGADPARQDVTLRPDGAPGLRLPSAIRWHPKWFAGPEGANPCASSQIMPTARRYIRLAFTLPDGWDGPESAGGSPAGIC